MSKPKNMFNKFSMMRKVLLKDLDGEKKGLRTCNKDRVIAVTGAEGMGKSNVVLGLFDIWYKEILKDDNYSEEYIKFFGSNKEEFLSALKECTDKDLRYMMVGHDEAAKDLYSRKAMSSFSADMNIAYQVIRGLNLFTILIIPSVLDLDSFFRKRRLTGLIHVFNVDYKNKQTQFAYYTKKRLDELIPEMRRLAERDNNPDPFKCDISPLFYDTAPLYSGVLKEAYEKRKSDNMKETVDDLHAKHSDSDKPKKTPVEDDYQNTPKYKRFAERIYTMRMKGKTLHDIQETFFLSRSVVQSGFDYWIENKLDPDEARKSLYLINKMTKEKQGKNMKKHRKKTEIYGNKRKK